MVVMVEGEVAVGSRRAAGESDGCGGGRQRGAKEMQVRPEDIKARGK